MVFKNEIIFQITKKFFLDQNGVSSFPFCSSFQSTFFLFTDRKLKFSASLKTEISEILKIIQTQKSSMIPEFMFFVFQLLSSKVSC